MWNIITTDKLPKMCLKVDGHYNLWVVEDNGYKVIITDISTDAVETVFSQDGFKSFYEAVTSAEYALSNIRNAV